MTHDPADPAAAPPGDAGTVEIGPAQLADQGRLAPLLLAVYGPGLRAERAAEALAGRVPASVEDECLAADDFYFSRVDLMDCCRRARVGAEWVGAACVNPYIGELQYVAVRPAWRRRGLGRRLVEGVLAELRRRGVSHARVDLSRVQADEGGRAFLTRLGFLSLRAVESFGRKP